MITGKRGSAAALLAAALSCPVLADTPPPFEASFEIHRNGKLIGESTAEFTDSEGGWSTTSQSHGTQGLAKFLGFEESTTSRGAWLDGAPRPDRFEQTVNVAIKTIETRAEFDWAEGTVRSSHEDGEDLLPLEAGTVDQGTVGLVIRGGLADGESEWNLKVVDEDEIEDQRFVIESRERIDTALGCMETVRVDKDRGPESTRYTRTWYAVEHGFAPVRVEHGKLDGDHMETRISTLSVDGQSVQPSPACPDPAAG